MLLKILVEHAKSKRTCSQVQFRRIIYKLDDFISSLLSINPYDCTSRNSYPKE